MTFKKIAIVTGASGGLGREFVRLLARSGQSPGARKNSRLSARRLASGSARSPSI